MKVKLLFLLFCISFSVFSQEKDSKSDSLSIEKKRKVELKLDIVSRYLWRGQCWGGNHVAIQPTITYKGIEDWEFEFWATTNFKNDADKGYQEIDFSVSYSFNEYVYVQIADYYWPSVEKVDGEKNGYFYYGKNGVKTVDLSFNFDGTEEKDSKYPFKATISTLIAGNDFRKDSNGKSTSQNFTTYLEVAYKLTPFKKSSRNILKNIEFKPVVGAVLNNKAEYYTYADYDKVSFCNMGVEVLKEFEVGEKGFKIPVSLNFIHNAASQNTEVYGKNFLVGCLRFEY